MRPNCAGSQPATAAAVAETVQALPEALVPVTTTGNLPSESGNQIAEAGNRFYEAGKRFAATGFRPAETRNWFRETGTRLTAAGL
jgi:hypothetical protein